MCHPVVDAHGIRLHQRDDLHASSSSVRLLHAMLSGVAWTQHSWADPVASNLPSVSQTLPLTPIRPWPATVHSWSIGRRSMLFQKLNGGRRSAGSRSPSPRTGARGTGRCRRRRRAPLAWRARGLMGSRSLGLPPNGRDQRAGATVVAVLAQVDALPGSQREPSCADRQRKRGPEQRGLDVRGHVIAALQRVRP